MKTFVLSSLALGALLTSQTMAVGQATTPRPRAVPAQPSQQAPAAQAQPSAQNNAQQIEQHAAACLLIGNQAEIAMSEFGMEKAESEQAKEFAREMVKEHTKMISKLRKFTPQQASFELSVKTEDATGEKAADNTVKTTTRSGETLAAKAAPTGSMMDQMLMMKRDMTQECLSITKECLAEHKGNEFDKAFIGMQVGAHIHMLAELRVLKSKTSGEFAALVAEGEKATEMHLDHAKKVMEELASSKSAGAAPREERNDRPAAPSKERPAPRREG